MKKYFGSVALFLMTAAAVLSIVGCKKKEPAFEDELVFVEGAAFIMGNDDFSAGYNNRAHNAEVSSFYVGSTEVTQADFEAVMGYNPSFYVGESKGKAVTEGENQEKRPVEKISWYEAVMYCNKLSESRGLTPVYTKEVEGKDETDISLWGEVPEKANKEWNEIKWNKEANGYRLLTEAEWEFAAKGGKLTSGKTSAGFDFYDDNVEYYVWAGINSKQLTHEVGLKEKNELGLYDMNGNVWEWCWDWFSESYYKKEAAAEKDTSGPAIADYRVVRGGSWEDEDETLTVFGRGSSSPHLPSRRIGFRIARSASK